MVSVKAFFKDGQLWVFDKLDLPENTVLQVHIDALPDDIDIHYAEVVQRVRIGGIFLNSEDLDIPEDAEELTEEEEDRLSKLFASDRLISDEIIEDRGEF